MWVLNELWNADKHRLIATSPMQLKVPVYSGPGAYVRKLDDGSVFIRVPRSAEPEKYLEPYLTGDILFDMPPPIGQVDFSQLRAMHHIVANEMIPLFARYLSPPEKRKQIRVTLKEASA